MTITSTIKPQQIADPLSGAKRYSPLSQNQEVASPPQFLKHCAKQKIP